MCSCRGLRIGIGRLGRRQCPPSCRCRPRAAPAAGRRPRAARDRRPARRATAGTASRRAARSARSPWARGRKPGGLPNWPSPVRSASQGKKPSSMSPTSVNSRPVASRTAASMRGLKLLGSTSQTTTSTPSSDEGDERTETQRNPFEKTHAADIVAMSAAAEGAEHVSGRRCRCRPTASWRAPARRRRPVRDVQPHAGAVLADTLDACPARQPSMSPLKDSISSGEPAAAPRAAG